MKKEGGMGYEVQGGMIWAARVIMRGALWIGTGMAQGSAQTSDGAQGGVKIIDNPDGGHLYLGALAGQPTPQDALGKILHRLSANCGDRPQLGRLVQNPSGEILAGFFTG